MTTERERADARERLYGPPQAEYLDHDPDDAAAAYQADERTWFTIEEWTVHPPRYHLDLSLAPRQLLDTILDNVSDSGELTDGSGKWFDPADPALLAAVGTLYDAIAGTVTWRQAHRHVATWHYRQPPAYENDDYPILVRVEQVIDPDT